MSKIHRLVKFWLPVFLWAGVIYFFSTLTTTPTAEIFWQDFIIKKSAHIVEYAIFALLLYRALKNSGLDKKSSGAWAFALAVLYAITDEYHQSFTPGRQPTFRDVIFDTIGAAGALYLLWKWLPKAPVRLRNWAKNWQLT